jgi:pimeloyl-ACP methyl ester carboxylesterase
VKTNPIRRGEMIDMKKFIPLAILALLIVPAYVVAARSDTGSGPKPSIVLVHGAWADGSSWSGVIQRLQEQGYTVYAPANPLRGLTSDSEYIASFLQTISGPIILVGHSYGGAVITNAATVNPNVKALVYIDAFAPDQGESLASLSTIPPPPGQSPSCVSGNPAQVFNFVPLAGGDVDLYIKPSLFPSCFANDLSPKEGAVLASTQRPFALGAFPQQSGVPAWKTIRSFYLVGTIDNAIPPFAQLFMARRANATIVQVRGSHLVMISHPEAVVDLINQAVHSMSGSSNANSGLTPTTL